MDYQDRLAGIDREYFTNKTKMELLEMLVDKIELPKDPRILSVGCGDGHELEVLGKRGINDVIDIEAKAIGLIPKGQYSEAFTADICDFKASDKYDLVVGLDVMEHIRDEKKAIRAIRACLKDGGRFIFTVPAHNFLFSAHDRAAGHYRRYSSKGLIRLLSEDFEVEYLSFRYSPICLPVVLRKLLRRNSQPKIDAPRIPKALNDLLVSVMRVEIGLMRRGVSIPFGIAIAGICKRRA